MFWQENNNNHFTHENKVQDATFNIISKVLPIDHIYLLSKELLKYLPWLEYEGAGIFDISTADCNGWQQNYKDGFFYPSKRSKLKIRLPKKRLNDVNELVGKTLVLDKYKITITKALNAKKLKSAQTLLAKNVAYNKNISESDFLQDSFNQLEKIGIRPKKMLAGLNRTIKTNTGIIHTRSLMITNLKKSESILLQEKGVGKHRLLGCGLFVPQKDIESTENT